jgi:hypothetical protein
MAKTATKNEQEIYRIFHYDQRYRFDTTGHSNRFQVGPPKFVKLFIGRGDDEETINFYKQKCAIKAHRLYDTLHTVYDELLELAAYQAEKKRGYILDGTMQPADIKAIAGLINRDIRVTKKAVEILIEVGLLEYVPVSEYRRDIGNESADSRQQTGKNRKPLNNKRKRKILSESRTRKDKQKTKGFETEFEKWKAIAEAKISHKSQEQNKAKDKSSPNPKINPTLSEALGGKPLYSKVSDIPLETVFKENIDVQAMSFAAEVYRLLKMPYMPGTLAARQELFNYYHAWLGAIKEKLPEPVLMSLWNDSIKSARRIGDRRGRKGGYKKPGAGWRSEFNKNLAIYQGGKASKNSGFD